MKKAKYVIVNSQGEYFVEISKINTIVTTKNKADGTKMSYSDVEELLPVIEFYTGRVAVGELSD